MFQIVPDIKHEIQGKPTNKPPLSANPSKITEICQKRYFLRKRLENLTNLSNFTILFFVLKIFFGLRLSVLRCQLVLLHA